MRRFIVAFVLGAVLICNALVGIGLGSHPERVAPLRILLIHSITLVMGAAIIGSGMVGMADGYEKVSRRLAQLLSSRTVDEAEVSLSTTAELDSCDRTFWTAYRNSSLAVALFMAAILAITVGTTGYSHLIYLACLSAGVALFGVTALLMTYRGMRTIRHRQRQVGEVTELLEELPEPVEEKTPARTHPAQRSIHRTKPRYSVEASRRRRRDSSRL
jgi:hypothetical protein